MRRAFFLLLLILGLTVQAPAQMSHGQAEAQPKKAIVLAAFGSTHASALKAILGVEAKVRAAFPGLPVRLAFTSNMIRNVWHSRAAAPDFQQRYPGVPEEITSVPSLLGALAELSDAGYRDVAVQSLHIAAGEEFDDVTKTVAGLRSIKMAQAKNNPFAKIVLGRPAMGLAQDGDDADLAVAAKALAQDATQSKAEGAALLYVGHGNPRRPNQKTYARLQAALRQAYPGQPLLVSALELPGSKEAAIKALHSLGAKKVILLPLLLVAGDHAANDLCGSEADSWAPTLIKAGFEMDCRQRGLGEVDAFGDIYLDHLRQAMTGLDHDGSR